MVPLQIKRWRASSVDAKQALREYVDRLPISQQREFVMLACQLMAARNDFHRAECRAKKRRLLQVAKQ